MTMDYIDALNANRGGFNFDNTVRNNMMQAKGVVNVKGAKKTGTTICGVVTKDCVILAADTRATAGPMVADKNCEKLHHITENIYCAGAGTSADLEHTTEMISQQVKLLSLTLNRQPRVCTVMRRLSSLLFRYQGHVGCALVLGGVDVSGPHLYQIYPHGSTDTLPFTSMGSGCVAAMAVLESRYKDNMTKEEGVQLVADAIRAGVFNDLGSGGNIDVCVVKADGVEYLRNHEKPNPRMFRAPEFTFNKGTTPVIKEDIRKFVTVEDGDVEMKDA